MFRLPCYRIENALTRLQFSNLLLSLSLGPLQKHSRKNVGRFFFARNQDTGTGPRETPDSLLHIHSQRQRWESRQMSNPLANILIQRDRVAKSGAARMWSGRQKTIVGWMSAVDVRMRHTAEHSEVVAIFAQHF